MSYFCTVLTEEWKGGLVESHAPFRFLWVDSVASIHIVRSATEGTDDVEVALNAAALKCQKLLVPLLQDRESPFTVYAQCLPDPMACPVALDLFVNGERMSQQMEEGGTFRGEGHVVELLHYASKHGFLVRRSPASDGEHASSQGHAKKRRRFMPLHETRPDEVVRWMQGREEEAGEPVALPHFLEVPHTSLVFCLRSMVFLARHQATWSSPTVSGGILAGDRSTGKSHYIKRLIGGDRAAASQGTPAPTTTTPPFLRQCNATLIVAPPHLLFQWLRVLAGLRVVMVHNKKKWGAACTLKSLSEADVVLTTHPYLVTLLKKNGVKHKSRSFASKPFPEVSHLPVRLDWLWWRRVVVDEALELYMRMPPRRPSGSGSQPGITTAVHARSWWALQGGVHHDSLAMCALVDMLQTATTVAATTSPARFLDAASFHGCVFTPTPIPLSLCPTAVVDEVIRVTLTPPQNQAYQLLLKTAVPVSSLLQVCAGDLTPVQQYVTPVRSWLEAMPLGLKVMGEYIYSQEMEFTWSGEGGGEDGGVEDEGGEDGGVGEPGYDPGGRDQQEEDADEGGGEEVLLDNSSEVVEMRDRQQFFQRVLRGLAMGTDGAGTCSVCLTNASDCVFVCGHLMCHECVIHLFLTSRASAQRELQWQGYEYVPSLMAPCPTCRWSVEPHEVFWVHAPTPPLTSTSASECDKFAAVTALVKPLVEQGERVVTLCWSGTLDGMCTEVAQMYYERLQRIGVSTRVLTLQASTAASTLQWFHPQFTITGSGSTGPLMVTPPVKGQVLVMYTEQLRGLKLDGVKHVIMLYPAVYGTHARERVKRDVQHCFGSQGNVKLYHFIARDTVEEATCGAHLNAP